MLAYSITVKYDHLITLYENIYQNLHIVDQLSHKRAACVVILPEMPNAIRYIQVSVNKVNSAFKMIK